MNKPSPPSVVFFAGPTISENEIRQAFAGLRAEVRVLPPVRQGDLLRLSHSPPTVIGIIDGYFRQAPAVLHKEILLLLESGVRILGAASLGALRAAELDQFGMEGVGAIYRMYKDGDIDGDDEVALMHAPAEDGYRKLSEPLVNIRHTLREAHERGELSKQSIDRLVATAQKMPFGQRTYAALLQAVKGSDEDTPALRRFAKGQSADVKKTDALELVRIVANRIRGDEPWPVKGVVELSRTKYFRILQRDYRGLEIDGRHVPEAVVLSFLKLFSRTWPATVAEVQWRCLAVEEARFREMEPSPVKTLMAEFRRSRNLVRIAQLRGWLRKRCLSLDELHAWLMDVDLASRVEKSYQARNSGDSAKKCRQRLRVTVARRVGVSVLHLGDALFMRPGILWEAPFLREAKINGEFASACRPASIVLSVAEEYWKGKPELSTAFAALSNRARPKVEEWLATRWGVDPASLSDELKKRGVVRYGEFFELARLACFFEQGMTNSLFFPK